MIDPALSRRSVLKALTAATLISGGRAWGLLPAAGYGAWDSSWDAAIMASSLPHMDRIYDPQEKLLTGHVGPEYSYQSNLRSQTIHPTRTSMEYALYLLESKDPKNIARAIDIINRMDEVQEKDPASRFFGLWGWYLEEPPAKMPAADFNWADFNGSLLLRMLYRRSDLIPAATIVKMKQMLGRCCISIQKRNVSMGYTNIAAMGTFVTTAAAEVLQDPALKAYASDRLRRFAAVIDDSGSFNEYNSPTYNKVVIQNMTSMIAYVKDQQEVALARKIHDRCWLHIGSHWHLPTRQIAPPMSRCYHNDFGPQLWIQKALNNDLIFMEKAEITAKLPTENEDVAFVDYHCPDEIKGLFVRPAPAHMHRELFLMGTAPDPVNGVTVAPTGGTTYLTPSFALGSINHGDFWIQRRPLMAYWGTAVHPVRCMQMRVIKDDYDFSSATFYSVQENGAALGQVRFRSDGGDKHISLDLVKNHTIQLQKMLVHLQFDVWNADWKIFAAGKEVTAGAEFPVDAPLHIDAGEVKIQVKFLNPRFADSVPTARFLPGDGKTMAMIELTLMSAAQPVSLDLLTVTEAGCGIAVWMTDTTDTPVMEPKHFKATADAKTATVSWESPEGKLELSTSIAIKPIKVMDEGYRTSIDGAPVTLPRLSNTKLLA